jgi:hypothetical protein
MLRGTAAVCIAVTLSSCGFTGVVPGAAPSSVPPYTVLPLTDVSRAQLEEARAAGQTIPFFEGAVKSRLDGETYKFKIVGQDPHKSTGTTYVPYVLIVLVISYAGGTVLDPTKPACGDRVSVERRFLTGPNFIPTALLSNGVNVGTAQLGDAFQRAEFWKILKSTRYHTVLQAARDPVVARVKAPSSSRALSGVCPGANHRVLRIPIAAFLRIVRSLMEKYSSPRQLPILLAYNTSLLEPSGCCSLGFHGAFKRPSGVQAYTFGTYDDPGADPYFPRARDISVLTHEIGEVLNDPFPPNFTPAWGHIGQYPYNCSNFFEVGDPLAGIQFEVKRGGLTYHPQELAFFSWFFRTRSIGTGGKYSFKGTFTSTQRLCG